MKIFVGNIPGLCNDREEMYRVQYELVIGCLRKSFMNHKYPKSHSSEGRMRKNIISSNRVFKH
jgi:hypothetical protein